LTRIGALPSKRQIELLRGIQRIHQISLGVGEMGKAAVVCLDVALQLTQSEVGWVGLLNPQGLIDTLALKAPEGETCEVQGRRDLYNRALRGLWAEPLKNSQPLLSNDPQSHPEWRGLPEGHIPLERVVCFPILSSPPVESMGVIVLGNSPQEYTHNDIVVLENVVPAIRLLMERLQSLEEMQARNNRLDGILQHLSSGVALYRATEDGQDFEVLDVNKSCEAMEGLQARDVVGKRVTEVFPGVEALGLLGVLKQVDQTGHHTTHPEAWYEDETHQRWVHNEVFKLNTGEVVAVYSDITGQVEQRKQLEDLNRRLGSVIEELERFTYVSSHDLREPLNKIAAFGERLKSANEDCPFRFRTNNTCGKAEKYLDVMVSATRRMDTLIQDLLAYSRAGRDDDAIAQEVSVAEVVHDAWESLSIFPEDGGPSIELEGLPHVWAQDVPLRQLFHNLFSNSLKFAHKDRPVVVRVSWEAIPEEYQAKITVSDNGIGFDPQYDEEIFGVFSRLYSRFEYPGTGIGLALVKRIAHKFGGDVTAEGHPGEGATFHIFLPLSGSNPHGK
jgi:signal transduction histidine kinase